MQVTDPIADMLTRIRNASLAKKESVLIPDSRLKRDLARALKERGYLESFETTKDKPAYIDIRLAKNKNSFGKIERVSRPGCRIYVKKEKIPTVLQGMGSVILSTSKGIMSGSEAKKAGVGGEIICKIY